MARYICVQCGTQYAESDAPPQECPICRDERQFVRWDGQAWTTLAELRRGHTIRWEPEGEGVTGIGVEPHFAIGQRALLVETPHGNVLWDCVALLDEATVARIGERGGLTAIAVSHPHYYTTVGEWSDAFGGVPVYLHAADRAWVQRPHPAIVHWDGDTLPLSPSATLIRCGGHFPGGTVMHRRGEGGREGAVFAGDILQVGQDRASVSFMYSYPNYIPLDAAAVNGIRQVLEPFAFDAIYGAFRHRNIKGRGREAFLMSVERYLRAVA